MKLAIITPIDTPYSYKGDIEYILAHMLCNIDYFKEAKLSPLYKLIDNSVHERREIPQRDYLDYALLLGVHELILQDVMDDCEATIAAKEEQLELYKPALDSPLKIMFSIQGATTHEIIDCLSNGVMDDRIHTIGLSFTLTPKDFGDDRYINYFLNRTHLLEKIEGFYNILPVHRRKPVHLLGSSSWLEPVIHSKYSFVRSCDSKLLSRLTLEGLALNHFPMGKPITKLDIAEPFNSKELSLLQSNLKMLKDYIKRRSNYDL